MTYDRKPKVELIAQIHEVLFDNSNYNGGNGHQPDTGAESKQQKEQTEQEINQSR